MRLPQQAHSFALLLNKRAEDRASGKIPDPVGLINTHIVNDQLAERQCAACGIWQTHSSKKLERCSKCLLVYYCGKECQRKDWRKHKGGCGTIP